MGPPSAKAPGPRGPETPPPRLLQQLQVPELLSAPGSPCRNDHQAWPYLHLPRPHVLHGGRLARLPHDKQLLCQGDSTDVVEGSDLDGELSFPGRAAAMGVNTCGLAGVCCSLLLQNTLHPREDRTRRPDGASVRTDVHVGHLPCGAGGARCPAPRPTSPTDGKAAVRVGTPGSHSLAPPHATG